MRQYYPLFTEQPCSMVVVNEDDCMNILRQALTIYNHHFHVHPQVIVRFPDPGWWNVILQEMKIHLTIVLQLLLDSVDPLRWERSFREELIPRMSQLT